MSKKSLFFFLRPNVNMEEEGIPCMFALHAHHNASFVWEKGKEEEVQSDPIPTRTYSYAKKYILLYKCIFIKKNNAECFVLFAITFIFFPHSTGKYSFRFSMVSPYAEESQSAEYLLWWWKRVGSMCMRGRKSSEEEEEEEEGTWLQGPIGTKDITALPVCICIWGGTAGEAITIMRK